MHGLQLDDSLRVFGVCLELPNLIILQPESRASKGDTFAYLDLSIRQSALARVDPDNDGLLHNPCSALTFLVCKYRGIGAVKGQVA